MSAPVSSPYLLCFTKVHTACWSPIAALSEGFQDTQSDL